MKQIKNILAAVALLALPIAFTSCEDVLGHWEKPVPVTPTQKELTDMSPDGTEAIDLGVIVDGKPLLFANMNIGATHEYDNGTFFAWGETEGFSVVGTTQTEAPGNTKTAFSSDWSDYKWGDVDNHPEQSIYTTTGITTLQPEDDAATANWGTAWRMPTKAEWEALLAQTNREGVTNYNGTGANGLKFINKTDASKFIFVPVAGYRWNSGWGSIVEGAGFYWTSSLHTTNHQAFDIHMNKNTPDGAGYNYSGRCAGNLVRAVRNISNN